MNNLALTYSDLGQLEDGRALQVQVLDAQKQVLGDRHPETLTSMHNLAHTHFDQGQYDQARALLAQAFSGRKHVLGISHRSTLGAMSKLADTYLRLGLWTEADKLQMNIEVYAQVFGEVHVQTQFARRVLEDIRRCRDGAEL
ncbi:hypothetical protein BN14_10066 [Rhizoctonia solani AG-1 IB]|nr:hypothetical protein BN14_10066 [Rhizoctonia solani AG-1 IB]